MPATLFEYQSIHDEFSSTVQGKWVQEQNLHLTLQFFGNTFEKDYLVERLSSIEFHPEASAIKGLALLNQDRILYAQVENPSLEEIYTQIQETFGLYDEQEFIPHITLMRIKRILDKKLLDEKIKQYEERPVGILHPNIELIQSTLTPKGAQYTLLKRFTA